MPRNSKKSENISQNIQNSKNLLNSNESQIFPIFKNFKTPKKTLKNAMKSRKIKQKSKINPQVLTTDRKKNSENSKENAKIPRNPEWSKKIPENQKNYQQSINNSIES